VNAIYYKSLKNCIFDNNSQTLLRFQAQGTNLIIKLQRFGNVQFQLPQNQIWKDTGKLRQWPAF